MKRKDFLMAICCMVAVGLLAVCSANAAVVAQSGFNYGSGIADPVPLTTLPAELDGQGGTGLGWTIPWQKYRSDLFSDGTATVQDTMVSEGDQAVLSSGWTTPQYTAWSVYGRAFDAQSTGKVLVEWTVRLEQLTGGAHDFESVGMYISDFDNGTISLDDYKTDVGHISIKPSDGEEGGGYVYQAYSGSSLMRIYPHHSIRPDTWYRFGALFDMDAQTYQVSLDDIDGDVFDGEYQDPLPFKNNAGLPSVKASAVIWVNQNTTTYFDEFRITLPVENVPGDTDHDGDVDEEDAQALATHWGSGSELDPATWEEGNFNGDYVVGPADAAILAAHWGDHNPPPLLESMAAVPEPSTVALLFALSLALLLGRRK